MRSLALAGQLYQPPTRGTFIPKIVIIDNSMLVCNFWRLIRHFAETYRDRDSFLINLPSLLSNNALLHNTSMSEFNQVMNVVQYFDKLFIKHGFALVRSMIMSTCVLAQSWGDRRTFVVLKNLFSQQPVSHIFMYPSNIVAYCYDSSATQDAVLQNIALVAPKLSVHTDLIQGRPENVYLITDHTPAKVKQQLVRTRATSSIPLLFGLFSQGGGHALLLSGIQGLALGDPNAAPILNHVTNKNYSRALRVAANYKQNGFKFVEKLLAFRTLQQMYQSESAFDINEAAGDKKQTALHYAALNGDTAIYNLLVRDGADPKKLNADNQSAEALLKAAIAFGPRI